LNLRPPIRNYSIKIPILSIFQIFAEHRLGWIEGAVHDVDDEAFVDGGGFGEGGVAAFPDDAAGGGVDEREIAALGELQLDELAGHLGIAFLAEEVHEGDGPLAAFGVGDRLALEVAPVVHGPGSHFSSECCVPFL
jgi:hypothetical protein